MEIGKTVVNTNFYNANYEYSDGEIEDILLKACKDRKENFLLNESKEFPTLYHLSSIRENVIAWLPTSGCEDILEIGSGCGAITGILSEKGKKVTCVELSERRSLINAYRHQKYDNIEIIVGNFKDIEPSLGEFNLITLIGVWEYSALYIDSVDNPFLDMLNLMKKHLKKDGSIVIAIENKTGLKYWNGAQEDHTGQAYDGLNDYISDNCVRTFSKREIEDLLKKAGIFDYEFFYPSPDYKFPERIYSDNHLPIEGEIRTFGKEYAYNRFYNCYDATLNDQIAHDRMFPYFSNSYIINIGKLSGVDYVKYNRERRAEFRIATKIVNNDDRKTVTKYALEKQAVAHINALADNRNKWDGILPNIKSVSCIIENEICQSEYIDGMTLDSDFYKVRHSVDKFITLAKDYIGKYMTPDLERLSEFKISDAFITVFGDIYSEDWKATEVTNVDLIFSNIIKETDSVAVAFDFEWVFDFPIPWKFPVWRAAKILYEQYAVYIKNKISKKDFLIGLGIDDSDIDIFESMENRFAEYVTGENRVEAYTRLYRKKTFMQSIKTFG